MQCMLLLLLFQVEINIIFVVPTFEFVRRIPFRQSLTFLITELCGTFLCCIIGSFINDFDILPKFPLARHGRILLQTFLTSVLVISAFNFTGGFYHPVLATVRTYGCRGFFRKLTSQDHFIVYWVGSITGRALVNLCKDTVCLLEFMAMDICYVTVIQIQPK